MVATRAAGNGARGGFKRRVHTEACGHERRTARDEVVQGDRESRRREGEGVVGPASFSAGGSRHPSSRAAIGCHCSQMCSATHRLRRPSASLHLSGGCCSGRRSVGSSLRKARVGSTRAGPRSSSAHSSTNRPDHRCVPDDASHHVRARTGHAAGHRMRPHTDQPPHARRMRPHPGKRMASQMGTDRVGHAPTSATLRCGCAAPRARRGALKRSLQMFAVAEVRQYYGGRNVVIPSTSDDYSHSVDLD